MALLSVPLLVPTERITARQVAGLLIGFAGVLCVFGVWRGVAGATWRGRCLPRLHRELRRHVRIHAALLRRSQRLGCGAVRRPARPRERRARRRRARARRPAAPAGVPAAVALLALGAVGTGWAYVLNLGVIRAAGPTVASTVTYVIPVWPMAIGALLLAEPVGWNTVVGGLVVVAEVTSPAPPSE